MPDIAATSVHTFQLLFLDLTPQNAHIHQDIPNLQPAAQADTPSHNTLPVCWVATPVTATACPNACITDARPAACRAQPRVRAPNTPITCSTPASSARISSPAISPAAACRAERAGTLRAQ
eukprot:scaffold78124_cov19-Tisochrysis_lutea.AAC.1